MITNEDVYAIADHVRNQSEKYKSWKRKNIDVLAPLKEMYGAEFEDTTIVITPDSVQDFANFFVITIQHVWTRFFPKAFSLLWK